MERQKATAAEQGDPPFNCVCRSSFCFAFSLPLPSVHLSVLVLMVTLSGMVMYSICIICGLTSTSGEDLKDPG